MTARTGSRRESNRRHNRRSALWSTTWATSSTTPGADPYPCILSESSMVPTSAILVASSSDDEWGGTDAILESLARGTRGAWLPERLLVTD